jgi:hypothetical protein
LSPFVEMLIAEAYQRLKAGQPVNDLPYFATEAAYNALEAETEAAKRATPSAKKKFRLSLAWRRTRYRVLALNAAKNGGVPKCVLCGRGAADGVKLHVDHELPVSTPEGWERRFDVSVLRCTCEDCNTGRLASSISLERGPAEAAD